MALAKLIGMAVLAASMLIAGCALPSRNADATAAAPSWHGRIAVRVEAQPGQTQALSFSAGFELAGNPQAGELMLLSPMGTTVASLSWSQQTAVMRANGDSQSFESLDALIRHAIGTDVPVAALFAWLAGDNMSAAGWTADLSNHASGAILARRSQPTPEAEIRLLLEK